MAQGGNSGDFDPANPANPVMPETVKKHLLSVTVSPTGAATVNTIGGNIIEGEKVILESKASKGYKFVCWMYNGNIVSETELFEYTMPERDVNLVAKYEYSPDAPDNPGITGSRHYLRVEASPLHSGTFNVDAVNSLAEDESINVITYPATGYKFKGWYEDGALVSDSYSYTYKMGPNDSRLTALYEYNPDNPHDFGSYIWIEETGELIADVYPAGGLSSLVEHPNDVQILTLSGFLDEKDLELIKGLPKLRILNIARCVVYSNNTENAIPDGAFSDMQKLEEVYMPKSAVTVGKGVLTDCPNLMEVFWNTSLQLDADALAGSGTNTNLLVFVPENCHVEYEGNVIYNNVAPSISLQYGKSFRCSQAFKAKDITYTRSFSRLTQNNSLSNGWETIVLPFEPSTITGSRRGVLTVSVSDKLNNANCYVGELSDNGFAFCNNIAPNTPLIFNAALTPELFEDAKAPDNAEILSFKGKDCLVHLTDERIKENDNDYEVIADKELFVGTWPKTVQSGDYTYHPTYEHVNAAENIYVLNNTVHNGDILPGGIFVNNGDDVAAMGCYASSSAVVHPETIDLNIKIEEPNDYIAEGISGGCRWYITKEGKLVVEPVDSVSGTLGNWRYHLEGWAGYDGAPWYPYHEQILSAEIKDGVIATTCAGFFQDCKNMTEVNLSGLNTENVTDISDMFSGCSSLTTLDLSKFNTQNATNIGFMFYGCSSLTSLDVSNFNTEKVTNMNGLFAECSGLTSLDLSNFNTQNVTYMSGIFDGCSGLTSLDLSNFDTQKVTNMDYMFDGCNKLTTIISNVNTPSALKVGTFATFANRANCTLKVPEGTRAAYAAADGWKELGKIDDGTSENEYIAEGTSGTCSWYITKEGKLVVEPVDGVSGTLDSWNFYFEYSSGYDGAPWYAYHEQILSAEIKDGVIATTCSGFFQDCKNMTEVNLSGLNTQNVTSMSLMFDGCSGLTSLDLSSFNTGNVTEMDDMFLDCSSLTSLDLSKFNTQNVTSMYDMFHGCSSLTTLDVSKFNTQNVTNMSWMFYGCSALTSLDLSNFNTQNVTGMSSMFDGCSALTSLDLSKFNTENVANMFGMFLCCSGLTSLDLSNFNTQNVTYMGFMFDGCSALTSLDLSSFNTQNVTDMYAMFSDCSALTSLDLSNFNTQNVTSMRGMFYGCSSLTSLDLSNFNTENVTGMGYMFRGCSDLTTLDVSKFNTQNVTEMDGMFRGCSSLTTLDVSHFDASKCESLDRMFSYMYNAKTISTPQNMKSGSEYSNFPGDYNLLQLQWNSTAPITQAEIAELNTSGNLIIFVPQGYEGEDVGNIVRNGYIPEMVIKNNMPMYTTQEFTAGKVSYTKEFTKQTYLEQSAGWETLMLPFDVKKVTSERIGEITPFHKGEGDKHFWLCGLTEQGFGKASRIKANIPYIIAMPNSDVYIDEYNISSNVTFSAENAIVMPTANTAPYKGKRYDIYGTYEAKENVFTLNQQNAYDEETLKDYYPGGAFVYNAEWVRPFEAYVIPHYGNGAKRVFPVFDEDDDDATDMYRVYGVKVQKMPDMIYDVMGRRLAAPRKGLNIINGRKVLTK